MQDLNGPDERRSAPRYNVLPRFDVTRADGTYLGFLGDLSIGGVRVCDIDKKTKLTDIQDLTLVLPRWLGLAPSISLKGRVLWYRETSKGLEAGFSLERVTKSTMKVLQGLIDSLIEAAEADGLDSILIEDAVPSKPA